jgi:AraC family transcriptional regulator of adaptative response/methylated-DNA-[protein]-cysteine methyltransferase
MKQYWTAVEERDRAMDGIFVYGVRTTKIYCRPSCPSRVPNRENVAFFERPSQAEEAGYRACLRCRPAAAKHPESALVESACRYIEAHVESGFDLASLARHMGYSAFHMQRMFKAVTGVTPRAYAQSLRVAALKHALRHETSVTGALYGAGYSSSSRVYETADAQLGMTPATYARGGAGVSIGYAIADSPLGRMLVAETGRGVCSIAFGDSDEELTRGLHAEFSAAEIRPVTRRHVESLLKHLEGGTRALTLPLDIRATAFQRRVWQELQAIPYAETRSYAQIARQLGRPTASRAVARACAANPVALAIPCHRVVRGDGSPGGYRWGIERKRALLAKERS